MRRRLKKKERDLREEEEAEEGTVTILCSEYLESSEAGCGTEVGNCGEGTETC